ncbi:MAG: hypothetical protein E7108_03315 [Bacteroidales bacterium]|jgi:YD repeat-containing protein|nr:hypothetical protein [Bacteroidales bacterium]
MKNKLLFLLLFFTLSGSSHLLAQSSFKFYDDISLPQTDAWNFVRQGEVSPSLYTGTINLSVPIYEYKDKDFTIPIVATYSSNGNTPNQLPGILGPGWNLELGGYITIETNGIPDYGENTRHVPGFYSTNQDFYYNQHEPSKWWRFMFFQFQYESGTGAPQIVHCKGTRPGYSHDDETDAQPDIFHFSVPGHKGSFHFGFRGDVIFYNTTLDPSGYKLEIETKDITASEYGFSRFKKITIISPDGYRYVFDGSPGSPSVDLAKSGERNIFDMITAWHLTKIVAPNGRWATFSYTSFNQTVYTPGNVVTGGGVSDTQYYFKEPVIPAYGPSGLSDDGRCQKRELRNGRLTGILFSDGSSIGLTYSTNGYPNGDQYKKNPSDTIRVYQNTVRLTGIYVNKVGGESQTAAAQFTHLRNNYGGKVSYLRSIIVQGIGTYSFDYAGWDDASKPYPHHNTFSVDHWGYYNGKNNNVFFPQTSINMGTQKEKILDNTRDPDASYSVLGMLEKITYPTGGYTTFQYEPHDYSTAVSRSYDTLLTKSFAPRLIALEGTAGGVRIKKISSYLSNGTLSQEKRYEYKDAHGKSSGILNWMPRYGISYECYASPGSLTESSGYKSSSLQDYGFTDVEYRSVTEHIKDSTRILNIFTSLADGKGFMDRLMVEWWIAAREKAVLANEQVAEWVMGPYFGEPRISVHSATAPLTSLQSQRGMLKERRVFKNDTTFSASLKDSTAFLLDTTSFSYLPCYLVRMFGTYAVFTGKHLPKETVSATRQDDMSLEKISRTQMEYNSFWEVTETKTVRPDGDTIITELTHLRDLEDNVINSSTVYSAMKRRNILILPIEEKTFRKKPGGTSEQIAGRRCTYALFPKGTDTLILPSLIESYDLTNQTWKKEAKILSYDNFGNITQLEDADGNTVSYLWSSDGQYLILQAKGLSQSQIQQYVTISEISASTGIPDIQDRNLRNAFPDADITTIRYLCGVGPKWMKDASGNITEYTYTQWGKLKETRRYNTASSSPKATKTTYSNDN